MENLPDGVLIGYRSSYAADVEFGSERRPITGDQIIRVKEFRRKDGAIVRAHTKTYHNKRIIRFRPRTDKVTFGKPIFRAISFTGGHRAQMFLRRATYEGIKHFKEDLEYCLRQDL